MSRAVRLETSEGPATLGTAQPESFAQGQALCCLRSVVIWYICASGVSVLSVNTGVCSSAVAINRKAPRGRSEEETERKTYTAHVRLTCNPTHFSGSELPVRQTFQVQVLLFHLIHSRIVADCAANFGSPPPSLWAWHILDSICYDTAEQLGVTVDATSYRSHDSVRLIYICCKVPEFYRDLPSYPFPVFFNFENSHA
jgi:hypothetical protein